MNRLKKPFGSLLEFFCKNFGWHAVFFIMFRLINVDLKDCEAMFQDLTRRDFIKGAAMSFLAVNTVGIMPEKVFAADNCTVKTKYGTFNGFVDENGVKTWLGIPFAQPPVGKLRWQAPQP